MSESFSDEFILNCTSELAAHDPNFLVKATASTAETIISDARELLLDTKLLSKLVHKHERLLSQMAAGSSLGELSSIQAEVDDLVQELFLIMMEIPESPYAKYKDWVSSEN